MVAKKYNAYERSRKGIPVAPMKLARNTNTQVVQQHVVTPIQLPDQVGTMLCSKDKGTILKLFVKLEIVHERTNVHH